MKHLWKDILLVILLGWSVYSGFVIDTYHHKIKQVLEWADRWEQAAETGQINQHELLQHLERTAAQRDSLESVIDSMKWAIKPNRSEIIGKPHNIYTP